MRRLSAIAGAGAARSSLRSVALLALAACHAPPISADEVEALLGSQIEAWSAGDFEAFCSTYWDDDRMTFVGGSGLVRGVADLVARYEGRYPDAASRGTLAFAIEEVRPLGPDLALVIARYHLERRAGNADGMFTLVVERRSEGLRIVHDHSSELDG